MLSRPKSLRFTVGLTASFCALGVAPAAAWQGAPQGGRAAPLAVSAAQEAPLGAARLRPHARGRNLSPAWSAAPDQAGAWFGRAVSPAGDVNGDGYADVIVGAPNFDATETDEGVTSLYLGSAAGLSPTAAWTAVGGAPGANFGFAIAAAGDVNGDGFADVVVGAAWYPPLGRAFCYLGSEAGLDETPVWVAEADQYMDWFGAAVAGAGDVNGDGFADIAIGAPQWDGALGDDGRVFVFHGSPNGPEPQPAWSAGWEGVGSYYGAAVAGAGDVNGDGFGDLIVGAYNAGDASQGRVFVYHGSAAGLSESPGWTAETFQDLAQFGYSAAPAGDVNGDGFADVLVGAYAFDGQHVNEGRVSLFLGSPSGLAAEPAWVDDGGQTEAWLGFSVAGVGDVNGDGFADVLLGAPRFDGPHTDEGWVRLFPGSDEGPTLTGAWSVGSGQDGAQFGTAVAAAGDVNGDGYADVIVGAPRFDEGQVNEGAAFVFHGGPGPQSLGTPCESGAECLSGACVDAVCCEATSCDDAIRCTADTCAPSGTCRHEPLSNSGDVSGDERITAGDAQLAFWGALGLYEFEAEPFCAADCNGSGELTAADAQTIFLAALGLAACVGP